ncbi:MAG: hypothetical protein R3B72_08830 [Polyangiaceae bacterium]
MTPPDVAGGSATAVRSGDPVAASGEPMGAPSSPAAPSGSVDRGSLPPALAAPGITIIDALVEKREVVAVPGSERRLVGLRVRVRNPHEFAVSDVSLFVGQRDGRELLLAAEGMGLGALTAHGERTVQVELALDHELGGFEAHAGGKRSEGQVLPLPTEPPKLAAAGPTPASSGPWVAEAARGLRACGHAMLEPRRLVLHVEVKPRNGRIGDVVVGGADSASQIAACVRRTLLGAEGEGPTALTTFELFVLPSMPASL